MIKGIKQVQGLTYLVGPAPLPMQVSEGGIIMVQNKKRKDDHSKYGRILAVGDGEPDEHGKWQHCKHKDGEDICFSRFTAPMELRGIEYRHVRQGDIVATVDAKEIGLDFGDYAGEEAAE